MVLRTQARTCRMMRPHSRMDHAVRCLRLPSRWSVSVVRRIALAPHARSFVERAFKLVNRSSVLRRVRRKNTLWHLRRCCWNRGGCGREEKRLALLPSGAREHCVVSEREAGDEGWGVLHPTVREQDLISDCLPDHGTQQSQRALRSHQQELPLLASAFSVCACECAFSKRKMCQFPVCTAATTSRATCCCTTLDSSRASSRLE